MTSVRPATPGGWSPSRLLDRLPPDLAVVRLFALALAALLIGYMFMGRGFAYVGIGHVYVGEMVLALALVAGVVIVARRGLPRIRSWTIAFLLLFMALGAVRTVPYLGTYGVDALRDGVLWGYGAFALVIYLAADRAWLSAAIRLYGWVVPVFALWLPISWAIFRASQAGVDRLSPGSNHPLVFFKAGDMAVHAVAAIAFIVLAPPVLATIRAFAARLIASVPLAWSVIATGAASRGAILAAATGVGATIVATRRPSNWIPVASAVLVVLIWMNAPAIFPPAPQPSARPGAPSPTAAPAGRDVSVAQLVGNLGSIFGSSSVAGLDGTKAFRLAWWSKIVRYTVLGPYFWTGKGFGVNLADDDGFQPTADHSLRAPHNSHMSVLARMGVPGFVLWVLLQAAFALALIRATLAFRRADDRTMAVLGAWLLITWAAMMVVTSFDPYLEGPQGGIWFWSVFGLGLVVTRMAPQRAAR